MTRQQKWAKAAFDAVGASKAKPEAEQKKFSTHCMKAPTLVRQAGLVQALAYLRTRGDEGKKYVDDLARALEVGGDGRGLLDMAQKLSLPEYMSLSRDASAVAVWLRRFAQAELKQEQV